MFKKKPDKFSVYLVEFAEHLEKTADYFVDFKVTDIETLSEYANTVKQLEREADLKVHQIIKDLNQAFITPIEREDILQLTMNLDDVVDGMEEFTAWIDIYQITHTNTYIDEFALYIQKCSKEILICMKLMQDGKLKDIEQHAIQIKDHESKCDDLYREALRDLFKLEEDPIIVIKYKDVYETLEEIADSCQDVANTLQSIIMKNA